MPRLGTYAAVGLAAALATLVIQDVAISALHKSLKAAAPVSQVARPGEQGSVVDRSRKSDRLPALAPHPPLKTVVVVEIVGLRDTAIVYRDRNDRVLFRSDPVANTTIVAKGVALPEVTVRETARSTVNPVPVEFRPIPMAPSDPARGRPPLEGCDPAFSQLTTPALGHVVGRCLAERATGSKLAAAIH